jgi:Zn-dependent M16 (insulinase) family peptidase
MTMLVATQLISQQYLHRALREEGGAYGGGVGYSSDGYVTFQSLYNIQCSEIFTPEKMNIFT